MVPGDQLRLEAEILKLKSQVLPDLRGRATVDGEVAAEGELVAGLLDREE